MTTEIKIPVRVYPVTSKDTRSGEVMKDTIVLEKSRLQAGALFELGDEDIIYRIYNRKGYITEKDEFRTFRVDRMEAISKPMADKRDGEKAFKAETLTSQEYKVFQQYHGEKVKVRIRFINRLADAVIDQFGKETVMVPIDKDHFYALLPVELSPPFCAWVATFGRGAKILAPEAAITEMRKFIEKVSDMYKDDGEK